MKNTLVIFLIALLSSCGNTADTVTEETFDGEYVLTNLQGYQVTSEEITITFNPIGNTVSGNLGCNRFSANYHQNGRAVSFTTPITTRKQCEGKMRRERRILSSIEDVSKFVPNGKEFQLLSEGNKPLMTLTKIK